MRGLHGSILAAMRRGCLFVALLWASMDMAAQCDGLRFRYRVFDNVEVTTGVFYGANTGSSGANVELDMELERAMA